MPPTYATSSSGRSRWRTTTSFWWWRAAGADAHVEQRLRALLLQPEAEGAVLVGREGQRVEVAAPDQPADVDAAPVGLAEQPQHVAALLAEELLVGVAAPVGEQHQVTRPGGPDRRAQVREVGAAVDQRADDVAARPRLVARVGGVEDRLRVGPLGLADQPRGSAVAAGPSTGSPGAAARDRGDRLPGRHPGTVAAPVGRGQLDRGTAGGRGDGRARARPRRAAARPRP